MKVLVQWAGAAPTGWQAMDSAVWPMAPRKPMPVGGEPLDTWPGWVNRLNVQGVEFIADHYAVEHLPAGACRVTCWWDDAEDYPPEMWFARQWTFQPLARDPKIQMRWNTRQTQVIYGAPGFLAKLAADAHGAGYDQTEIRPWAEFVPPAEVHVRHGVWLPNEVYRAHEAEARRVVRGWREWTEGVPVASIRNGQVVG